MSELYKNKSFWGLFIVIAIVATITNSCKDTYNSIFAPEQLVNDGYEIYCKQSTHGFINACRQFDYHGMINNMYSDLGMLVSFEIADDKLTEDEKRNKAINMIVKDVFDPKLNITPEKMKNMSITINSFEVLAGGFIKGNATLSFANTGENYNVAISYESAAETSWSRDKAWWYVEHISIQ